MKSSLATRKFDRIFSTGPASYSNLEQQSGPVVPKSAAKEVHWQMDKTIRKSMDTFGERLDEQLRQLQSYGLAEYKLLLDDETLHELRKHFLETLQKETGGGGSCETINWRHCDDEETVLNALEKKCSLVLAQLRRLQSRLACSDGTKEMALSTGGDEDSSSLYNGSAPFTGLEFTNSKLLGFGGDPFVAMLSMERKWQFWFWRSDQRYLKWDFGLQKLGKPVENAAEMTAVLCQLIDIHEVAIPSDYLLFRASIKPKWEDAANKDGGSWILEFERSTTDVSVIQSIWERLMHFLFESPKTTAGQANASVRAHIRGLKISMRFKSYQISVWTGSFVE